MAWEIQCGDKDCKKKTVAYEIVDLIENHCDKEGWFCCSCGRRGYVQKSFDVQEKGAAWEPFLKGIIRLGSLDEIYQPFVFLVGYSPTDAPKSVWFSYYKDARPYGRAAEDGTWTRRTACAGNTAGGEVG